MNLLVEPFSPVKCDPSGRPGEYTMGLAKISSPPYVSESFKSYVFITVGPDGKPRELKSAWFQFAAKHFSGADWAIGFLVGPYDPNQLGPDGKPRE